MAHGKDEGIPFAFGIFGPHPFKDGFQFGGAEPQFDRISANRPGADVAGAKPFTFDPATFTAEDFDTFLRSGDVGSGQVGRIGSGIISDLADQGFDTDPFDTILQGARFDIDVLSNETIQQAIAEGRFSESDLQLAIGDTPENANILIANLQKRQRAIERLEGTKITDEELSRDKEKFERQATVNEKALRREQSLRAQRTGTISEANAVALGEAAAERAAQTRIVTNSFLLDRQDKIDRGIESAIANIELSSDLDSLLSGFLNFQVQAENIAQFAEDMREIAPMLAMNEFIATLFGGAIQLTSQRPGLIPGLFGIG